MTRRRRLLSRGRMVSVLAGLMILVTAACSDPGGSEDDSATTAATDDTTAVETTASTGTGERLGLELWTFLDPTGDEPRGVALRDIVSEFNESQDRIEVTVRHFNFQVVDNEVIRATAAGTGPDIVNIFTAQLPLHVESGTIQPIGPYARAYLDEVGDEYLFPLEGVTYDGSIMTLPWESRVMILAYRQDLLDAAGLDAPSDLDGLAEVAGALSDDNTQGMVIHLSQQGLGAGFTEPFLALLMGFGGEMFDADGNATFNSEAGVQAIEWIKSLVETGAMDQSAVNLSADDRTSGLQAGTLAMAFEGNFRMAAVRSGEVGEHIRTIPMPGPDSNPLPTLSNGQTLGIGINTDHPDEAWEFIEFYLSPESQARFAGAGVMPVIRSVYDMPAITDSPQAEELAAWSSYLAEHGRLVRLPADYNELSDTLVQAAQEMVFRGAPVAETLDRIAAEYNAGR